MNGQETIDLIGLNKAISTTSKSKTLSESKSVVLNQAKEFGIDAVYFNTDENENSFPAIFLKKINSFDIDSLKDIANTQKKAWNFKKVLFLYVNSETEIRIYNCSEKPIIKTQDNFDYNKELQAIEIKSYKFSDKEQLQELNQLFSTIAIDTGIIWTLEDAQFIRNKINLQRRVDKYLVDSLVNTADKLQEQGLEINFIHKIILRSLFLLFLEDRKATNEKFYSKIRKGAKSYFDILNDVNSTYDLFDKLEEHFNGNVFTLEDGENITTNQLQLIKKCFISGNDNTPQTKLFEDWRLFDFSIIQVELLSEIYENFLFKTDPILKKKTGTYYTPPSLVEFILNEKLPVNNGETKYDLKILDPTCGSGIFLVESFKRLVKRYQNFHNIDKLTDYKILVKLLEDNIFGVEYNAQAIKVAAFSLYLALIDNLDPKDLWQKKKHRLPNLINNPEDKSLKVQGGNLFCRDTIKVDEEIENIEFNLVVGNPPFGTKDLLESVKNYCKQFDFAKEMVLPFLHKSTKFSPNGEIALIFNTKVLTNTGGTYQNFRKWLFNENYVEKIYNFSILRNAKKNFGGQLFGDATGPISIVFYQKERPTIACDTIAYYAPKTYIKSNIIEGLNIDFTDLKHLPRKECQKPDTKIWKIAMWGGMKDWELIKNINERFKLTIADFLKQNKNKFNFGSGLHSPSKKQIEENKILSPNSLVNLRKVRRYYTTDRAIEPSNKVFRSINEKIFDPPYLLIKEGQKDKELCASYIDYASYNTGYNISEVDKATKESKIKFWTCLINSSFAKYYLTLTSSSWGIERERVQANETLALPSFSNIETSLIKNINKKLDSMISIIKHDFNYGKTKYLEEGIDNFILDNILELSERDKWSIQNILNNSIDLFDNKEKSKALFPVLQEQVCVFSSLVSKELNNFLNGQGLFANATIYNNINRFTPLMMIKISFNEKKKEIYQSNEFIDEELKKLDKRLWEEKATNIYFRKILIY